MPTKRLKKNILFLFLAFILSQSFILATFLQSSNQTQLSKQELALRQASQTNHQVYCVSDWKAQFKPNPLPIQNQHPVFAFQLDPFLMTFIIQPTSIFIQTNLVSYKATPIKLAPLSLLDPPRWV